MSLVAGTRLGPYEVLAPIGAGGMGEVYRARDTNLKRDVALKVLPEAFARDPDRMRRFQREAEVLASLNHPNIAHIYGVEERALVMELVEGDTVRSGLPIDTAVNYAKQMAEALEYAHERGVVHRDLKPANMKVTPDGIVKLLDFGLAKAIEDPAPPSDPANSPTLTLGATRAGVIMGTAAYMSPEQASGKTADRRADIWSFGAVLYEMLAGERAFKGESVSDTLASVLKLDPDWDALPVETPGAIRKLVQRCLTKDRKQRLQAIGEARITLERPEPDEATSSIAPSQSKVSWFGWIGVGLLAIASTIAIALLWPRSQDRPLMRLSVDLGTDAVAGTNITAIISPDGTRLVYRARGPDGKQQLATRLLDQAAPTLLRGTEGASDPFFSPDGQWVGFFADSKLKKIAIQGGAPVTLCDAVRPMGGTWVGDGSIIAALSTGAGLARVPEGGGNPERVTTPEHGELTHRYPQFLSSSNAVLFTASQSASPTGFNGASNRASIQVLSLKTGARRTLVPDGYFGRYLPTTGSIGHLIYIQQGTLFAVPFDPARLELRGTPTPLFENVAAQIDFSRTGTFLYGEGNRNGSDDTWTIMWLDRTGNTAPLIATPGSYETPRFSPDGHRLALRARGSKGQDIYIYDLQAATLAPITFDGQGYTYPVWTPDGKHLVFNSQVNGNYGLWWIRADGSGQAQRLLEEKSLMLPYSFSPDGLHLAYAQLSPGGTDLWILPLDLSDPEFPRAQKPQSLLRTGNSEVYPAFSPDGRWMAYSSDESGRREIYVAAFESSKVGLVGKWKISAEGGENPMWSRDGSALFFTGPDHRIMMANAMPDGAAFVHGKPLVWSPTQIRQPAGATYLALHPDGKRFAVFPVSETKEQNASVHLIFLLNFFDELRRRVPEKK